MIKTLEIEITTRCNAKCDLCPRFANGQENSYLGKHDIDPIILQTNISKEIWDNIEVVTLKGTVGDVLFHPKLDEILDILHDKKCRVELVTNGSARPVEWWTMLAEKWGSRISVVFGLDGTDEKTHFLYRKTNFNKIIDNATSFINNNGIATWFMIVFRHNQHQIQDAKQMSKKLGFKKFESIFSERYDDNNSATQVPIVNDDLDAEMQFGENFNEKLHIKYCPKLKNESYYIASDGIVWPCCMYGSVNLTTDRLFWNYYKKILKNDLDKINLNINNINDILKHPIWDWWKKFVKTQPKKCLVYCGKLQGEKNDYQS